MGRGAARQHCGEMGLAWRREEGREVILVGGFRTLTHIGKKLIKKSGTCKT